MKHAIVRVVRVLFIFLIILGFPSVAFAQQDLDPCAGGNSDLAMCATKDLGIGGALGTVIQFLFVIGVILALGFLVFGGIKWITSGGDKGGVEAARNTIIAAIVGLIVIFLAYVVINLILLFLTGEGIGGVKIPTLGEEGATGSTWCGTDQPTISCYCVQTEFRSGQRFCIDQSDPRAGT